MLASAGVLARRRFGADQSCNDNPALNSLHGTCNQDGTCTCHAPFGKSPTTGRCL